ncbi:MAG: hypothetical protein WBC52_04870 [Candidatus Omnitrophota bacterium]
MNSIKDTIELLRIRSRKHLEASMKVDFARIWGFWDCARLADQLEQIDKFDIQENIE